MITEVRATEGMDTLVEPTVPVSTTFQVRSIARKSTLVVTPPTPALISTSKGEAAVRFPLSFPHIKKFLSLVNEFGLSALVANKSPRPNVSNPSALILLDCF